VVRGAAVADNPLRMQGPDPDQVQAAARRLRGHLVATPLIGAANLPGLRSGADLRLKPETLQPGGSLWYRGAMHHLQRQLGRCKGLAVVGPPRQALAALLAAAQHRLPVHCFWDAPPPAGWRARLAGAGCVQEVAEDPREAARAFCARTGYHCMPGPEGPEVAAGLATVGLELASELPAACEIVFVSPDLGPAVSAGLAAGGRGGTRVREVADPAPAVLGEALAEAHRLLCDPEGLAVLQAALVCAEGSVCALLAS